MASFANAVKEGKIDIVPKTLVNAGSGESASGVNAFESMLMLLLSEKLTEGKVDNNIEVSEEVKKIRDEILNQISNLKKVEKEDEIVNQ